MTPRLRAPPKTFWPHHLILRSTSKNSRRPRSDFRSLRFRHSPFLLVSTRYPLRIIGTRACQIASPANCAGPVPVQSSLVPTSRSRLQLELAFAVNLHCGKTSSVFHLRQPEAQSSSLELEGEILLDTHIGLAEAVRDVPSESSHAERLHLGVITTTVCSGSPPSRAVEDEKIVQSAASTATRSLVIKKSRGKEERERHKQGYGRSKSDIQISSTGSAGLFTVRPACCW